MTSQSPPTASGQQNLNKRLENDRRELQQIQADLRSVAVQIARQEEVTTAKEREFRAFWSWVVADNTPVQELHSSAAIDAGTRLRDELVIARKTVAESRARQADLQAKEDEAFLRLAWTRTARELK